MPDYVAPYTPVSTNLTIGDIIYLAARKAGALKHAGQGLNDSENQEFLSLLNSMVNGWKLENLLFYYYIRQVVFVQPGQKAYSVGVGGDFNFERVEKIERGGFILNLGEQTEAEIEFKIVETYEEYVAEVAKNTQSTLPLLLWYQASVPMGTATFWPVPSKVQAIALYQRAALQEFTDVGSSFYAPDGFREALEFNLAWRIHQNPPYNKETMDQTVIQQAEFYKTRIKNMQVTPLLTTPDPIVSRRQGNWYGGIPKAWTPYS